MFIIQGLLVIAQYQVDFMLISENISPAFAGIPGVSAGILPK
jgi:hypothetical protein